MFNGYKVVSVTPFGRRRYVSLLDHYLRRARGIIDEHHFWVNTKNDADVEWLRSCVATAPDFYRTIEIDQPYEDFWTLRIHTFFHQYPNAPDTIFIRFDDDIVWIESQAIERLLAFRVANPRYFLVFAN